jgi:hypothetical protein
MVIGFGFFAADSFALFANEVKQTQLLLSIGGWI